MKIEQSNSRYRKDGLYYAIEAALGADVVSYHEAHEFADTIEQRNWMTTSCCPAFVRKADIKKTYPLTTDPIFKTTVSPTGYNRSRIKNLDPDATK